ncbi:hypothetical protein C8R45DRAFT_1022150 [Mycena sanguinolenta]|nr:hypothetical protein C8R45DRAFT_1022150 [Mycena sanguinolenta]
MMLKYPMTVPGTLKSRSQLPLNKTHGLDSLLNSTGLSSSPGTRRASIKILQDTASKLRIPVPRYIPVSVPKKFDANIPVLVDMTCQVVDDTDEHLKGDAWVIWSVAQRASVPLKIEACIAHELPLEYLARFRACSRRHVVTQASRYHAPRNYCVLEHPQRGARRFLSEVSDSMYSKGCQLLTDDSFRHLMLYVASDFAAPPPDLEKTTQILDLCTAIAPVAPPAAILGLEVALQ